MLDGFNISDPFTGLDTRGNIASIQATDAQTGRFAAENGRGGVLPCASLPEALAFGFNNLTNNGNPNVVNSICVSPYSSDVRKGTAAGCRGPAAHARPEAERADSHRSRANQLLTLQLMNCSYWDN